jgi:hypothetical protein
VSDEKERVAVIDDLPKDEPPDFGQTTPPAGTKDQPEEKPKGEKKPPRPRTPRLPPLEKQLNDAFGGIAMMIMATGDTYCAEHLASQAESLAKAWADLAKTNAAIEAMLRRMMEGSAWGAVIFTTAATVIPIAWHHGMYPKNFPMPFDFGLGPKPPPSKEVREAGEGDKQGN